MKKLLISFFILLTCLDYCHSTDLIDIDWATGSTCSATNVCDGFFSTCDAFTCNQYDIGTGGPGSRNFLKLVYPGSDVTNMLSGGTNISNPATVYVRFWFRWFGYTGDNNHPLFLSQNDGSNYGFALMRGYAGANTFSIFSDISDQIYYYSPGFSLNTWYRIEYKITGGGGSSGTVLVRIDGVDATSDFLSDSDSQPLTTRNGSLTVDTLNYIYIGVYYLPGSSGNLLDLTGIKVTDGPDWIGGDDTPADQIISGGVTLSGASLQ